MKKLQHFASAIAFLIFICATSAEKKKALISVWSSWMHCIIPVIVPTAVIQQNIEQFYKKHSAQTAQVHARDL